MIARLVIQRDGLIHYLKMKVEQEDWHGVQDAASDIREVEAKIEVLKLREQES